jgi:hypothetical protein
MTAILVTFPNTTAGGFAPDWLLRGWQGGVGAGRRALVWSRRVNCSGADRHRWRGR